MKHRTYTYAEMEAFAKGYASALLKYDSREDCPYKPLAVVREQWMNGYEAGKRVPGCTSFLCHAGRVISPRPTARGRRATPDHGQQNRSFFSHAYLHVHVERCRQEDWA